MKKIKKKGSIAGKLLAGAGGLGVAGGLGKLGKVFYNEEGEKKKFEANNVKFNEKYDKELDRLLKQKIEGNRQCETDAIKAYARELSNSYLVDHAKAVEEAKKSGKPIPEYDLDDSTKERAESKKCPLNR